MMPTDIHSLPDELLSDILVRLPADHIHDVARLVCPRWHHIVHSSVFVEAQIQHSTYGLILSRPQTRALITPTKGGRIEKRELGCTNKAGLYGSCNGLTLDYCSETKLLHIMNPATKQELVLPSCSRRIPWASGCGIAYVAASMEYKVIVPLVDGGDPWREIYLAILTVGVDESWRNVPIKHLSRDDRTRFSCYALTTEGSIHWVMRGWSRVLTLDVETETFTTSIAPLPEDDVLGPRFLSTGRFLSLLVPQGDLSWEVWGMGSRDREWSKVLPDIDLGPHESRLEQQFACGKDRLLRLNPIGWVNYPEVLALDCTSTNTGPTCIFFNLETGEIDSIELPKYYCYLACHVHKNNMAWYV